MDRSTTADFQTHYLVPVTTLDTFVEHINIPNKIRFIKIDVEGAELRVLQGSIKLLTEAKPLILCELHGEDIARQVFDFLVKRDYQWELIEYMNENRQHILAFPANQAHIYRPLILQ